MPNKLDDRYVVYDLTSAINLLPIEHGGTGNQTITPGYVIVSEDNGGTTRMKSSLITDANLGALQNISAANLIETRLGWLDSHLADTTDHVPTSVAASQYLRSNTNGKPSWNTGQLPTVSGDDTKYLAGDNTWKDISALTGVNYTSGGSVLSTYIVSHYLTGVLNVGWRSASAKKCVQAKMPAGGAVDVYIFAQSSGGSGYAYIAKNGVAQTGTIATNTTQSLTKLNISVNAGDTIEVWLWGANSGDTAVLREFRIHSGVTAAYIPYALLHYA